jgi:hypothetical protein
MDTATMAQAGDQLQTIEAACTAMYTSNVSICRSALLLGYEAVAPALISNCNHVAAEPGRAEALRGHDAAIHTVYGVHTVLQGAGSS